MGIEEDSAKWERIRELEQLLVTSQDACEKAIEAGNQYKAAADEGAKRTEEAERRVFELTKNRELFQEQRDVAIRERDRARDLCDRVMKTQPCTIEVEKIRLQPGELVICQFKTDATAEAVATWAKAMAWLRNQYPQNTFIVLANKVDFDLRIMAETELRRFGLITAVRVDAGIQQLEAAFGTQQAAIRKCRDIFYAEVEQARPDNPSTREQHLAELVESLDKLLSIQLQPEPRPTHAELMELLRRCRPLLVWNVDPQMDETEESIVLDTLLEKALGTFVPGEGKEGA